jgi:hypothetical protein
MNGSWCTAIETGSLVAFRSVRLGIDVRCLVICRAQGGKIVAMSEDDTKIYWVSKEALKHIE